MYEPKMKENENSVTDFIESVENEKKKADAYQLLDIFEEVTGYDAKMWGLVLLVLAAITINMHQDAKEMLL